MSQSLWQLLAFIGGLALLWAAANATVHGASSLAIRMGVRPIVVGLTVVAFGTSAPEMVVSVIAAATDSPDIAVGNVIGSNIANVGLIVGLSALIAPLSSHRSLLKMDLPVLGAATALLYLVSLDGTITRIEGLAMFLGLVFYVAFTYRTADRRGAAAEEVPETQSRSVAILYLLAGLLGLTGGARLMVWAAVEMAREIGISEVVIGATIVAIGTSLPELATSVAAAARGHHDISLGNVIGSNIFNTCSILGLAPMVRPLIVHWQLLLVEFPLMIGFSVALALMMAKPRNRVSRAEGAALLLAFAGFLAWSFYSG